VDINPELSFPLFWHLFVPSCERLAPKKAISVTSLTFALHVLQLKLNENASSEKLSFEPRLTELFCICR
jgi:hypothetical protein